MPNPKRRHSKSRRDKRRTHWKLTSPSLSICPNCKEVKLSHHICPKCGYYNGKEIVKKAG
jgi:large subunit ribosomal protein L32